ncbi:unnamed protein product [Closterium sp. Naga37s-1]|nr:unnamed protein product [Closterium sp. Naga37s-1]
MASTPIIRPRPTAELFARYAFTETIGQGHFGKVWRCLDRTTGEALACKQVRKTGLSDNDLADLEREISAMQLLQGHRHVLALRGLFEDDNNVYMITDLCTGGDMFDLIARTGGLDEDTAARLFAQIAQGLTGSTRASRIWRQPYDFSADIWSLGVLLYSMLAAGWPSFPNNRRQLRPAVDFADAPWQTISRKAKDLIRRMLTQDQFERLDIHGVLQHPWLASRLAAISQKRRSTAASPATKAAVPAAVPAPQKTAQKPPHQPREVEREAREELKQLKQHHRALCSFDSDNSVDFDNHESLLPALLPVPTDASFARESCGNAAEECDARNSKLRLPLASAAPVRRAGNNSRESSASSFDFVPSHSSFSTTSSASSASSVAEIARTTGAATSKNVPASHASGIDILAA